MADEFVERGVMARRLIFGLCLVAVLAFGGLYFALTQLRPHIWHGSVFQAAQPAFDIALTDTRQQAFRLSQNRGRITLVFFGYTSCPDECPLTLAKLKQVKADLGASADQVAVVFVTVDPHRDTPEKIQAYLANFDPSFTGLTGSLPQLEAAWKGYGVYNQTNGGAILAGYQVSHSSELYLVDAQGRLRLAYGLDNTPQDIEQDILYLIGRG